MYFNTNMYTYAIQLFLSCFKIMERGHMIVQRTLLINAYTYTNLYTWEQSDVFKLQLGKLSEGT